MKYLLALLVLVSCTKIKTLPNPVNNPITNVSASPSIIPKECNNGDWCAQYNQIIILNITDAMLAYNPGAKFCPNWSHLDKDLFWTGFVKSIAKTESNWNVNEEYLEDFEDDGCGYSTGTSISTGLLQLSYGDRCVYPTKTCKTLTIKNLKDAKTNLTCALEIMDSLIRSNRPLSDYWSSTDFSKSGNDTLNNMKQYIPQCYP